MTIDHLNQREVARMIGVDTPTLTRMIAYGDFPKPDTEHRGFKAWTPKRVKKWADTPRCLYGTSTDRGNPRCWKPRTTQHDPHHLGMCDQHTKKAYEILGQKFTKLAQQFDRDHDHIRKNRK